ncbi:MAG: TauD/TfdA family dioxygenase [Gammaproteobacteria bacterium]|nr:TauD/TfdA family dioxygenase [Gammaproteobacteria bacterium]
MNATLDQMATALNGCDENSPFLLENETAYQTWRTRKLEIRQQLAADRVFDLDQNARLPESVLEQVRLQVNAYNFALFQSAVALDKGEFIALNRQFGLNRLDSNLGADSDGVTSLRVVGDSNERAQYIPYTNRALNWHTDGYYNPHQRRIPAFALYCVKQAARGGGNYLFDHELMYILIRDQAAELLAALMSEDMMLIPPNVQDNRIIRAEETGPVFSIQPGNCGLHMRYTSRPRNIVWKSDKRSEQALNLVREILMDSDAVIELRLQNNQGIVCNNILHGRQAFHDREGQSGRLIYRARYSDTIDLGSELDPKAVGA